MARRRGKRADFRETENPGNVELGEDFLAALIQEPSMDEAINPSQPLQPTGIAIKRILPDPTQPRRALPQRYRAALLEGTPAARVLAAWEAEALQAAPLNPQLIGWRQQLVASDLDTPVTEDDMQTGAGSLPPVAAQWMAVVGLAADIQAKGLQQPIAVYEDGDQFRLLFGERRWLAHQVLVWDGYKDYSHIPALLVRGYDPIVQALENGARQDLNAIQTARMLATILIRLNNGQAMDYDGPQPDWSWYAQAGDAKRFRLPRGKADLIVRALGLGSRQHFSLYRQLLNLPAEVAELADLHAWTEYKIRGLVKAAEGSVRTLITLARQEAGLESRPRQAKPSKVERMQQHIASTRERVAQIGRPDEDIPAAWRETVAQELAHLVRVAQEQYDAWKD